MSCIWTMTGLLNWDQEKLMEELTLLATLCVGFSLTSTVWMVVCSVTLPHWLPSFLLDSFHRVCKRLGSIVSDSNASLSNLATDLEHLLGDSKPTPWDWTSLITDPHHVYLDDRPSELPLPKPSVRIMPWWWRLRYYACGLLRSTRVWLWCSLGSLTLRSPWTLVSLATHLAMATLITITCSSTSTPNRDIVCYATSIPMHLASYLSDAFLPSTHPSHPVSKLLQMVDELSPDYSSQLVSFRADPVTSTIRHILESSYEWHEDRLEELLDVARVDASSLSAVQTDIETSLESTAADLFLSSFNPATSGMRMLLSERLDQMVIRPSVSQNRVSVHLGRCRQWMREFANSNLLSFPALLESVFNSIGNDGRIPLVVDTGASCRIHIRH
jgi:hypothetical protein